MRIIEDKEIKSPQVDRYVYIHCSQWDANFRYLTSIFGYGFFTTNNVSYKDVINTNFVSMSHTAQDKEQIR